MIEYIFHDSRKYSPQVDFNLSLSDYFVRDQVAEFGEGSDNMLDIILEALWPQLLQDLIEEKLTEKDLQEFSKKEEALLLLLMTQENNTTRPLVQDCINKLKDDICITGAFYFIIHLFLKNIVIYLFFCYFLFHCSGSPS